MATPSFVNPVAGELVSISPSFDSGNSFVAPALINTTRGITFTVATNTDEIPDAANPSNAAVVYRSIKSVDSKISGNGYLDSNSVVQYTQWAQTGASNPVKIKVTFANATSNSMTITGNYILESFAINGERAKKSMVSLSLVQASATTVTVA